MKIAEPTVLWFILHGMVKCPICLTVLNFYYFSGVIEIICAIFRSSLSVLVDLSAYKLDAPCQWL